MDFDDFEAPSKPPSRVSKFAPKSSKLKPKPKSEPPPKPEPEPETQPQPPSSSKPEPHEFDLTANKKEDDGGEAVAASPADAKPEPNGAAKIDVEPKSETEVDESRLEDPMSIDGEEGAEEEDAVVREIDVFFTPSIDAETKLYVLQYPLRPCWRPYELDERCEEVRLKPKSSNVEIDLSIDPESNNIDKEFASKVNFKKQTLATSWNPPPANGYAVGLLMGDKLHLHPIHAVVQLRPSLQHLYSGGSTAGQNATVKVEGSNQDKSVAAPKKQNKQIESSIEQKSDSDECWVPLKYHSCKSDISSRYLQQMGEHESSPINFTMNACDYVTTLCPLVKSNALPNKFSKRYLLSLPLEERLKKLLEGSPLHRFSAIKHFAPEYSEEELLRFLQQHAVLLHGLWTAKSALLYPDGGVETLARDFAILLFSKNLTVQSSDVNVRRDLGNHVKKFLKIFGLEKIDPRKSSAQPIPYWKFSEFPDESFKKLHPNIVEKQEELLKSLEQQVSGFATGVGKRKLGKDATANRSVNSELVKSANPDQRGTNLGGEPLGKMTMSNETRHALPVALKKLFQTHKVCSFQMICRGLRELAVSNSVLSKGSSKVLVDAAHSLDGPPHELRAVVNEVACDIHGYYVLKSSQDEPFRDVLIDLLRGIGPDGKLKKAEVFEAARRKLGREITNNEYNKVMGELCVTKGSVWVLKRDDRITQ